MLFIACFLCLESWFYTMKNTPEDIAKKDGRYSPQAFRFVYEGLDYTVKMLRDEAGFDSEDMMDEDARRRHVTGQMLCEGLRRLALERWGRLALLVLNSWGIKTTRDFGEIVYTLIEHEWMSAQDTDTLEDFDNVYSFPAAFIDNFAF